MVLGCHIDFDDNIEEPSQMHSRVTQVSVQESALIDAEVQKLLAKGVLEEAEHCEGEWLSTVFLRPKKNGEFRMILNLKGLNSWVTYKHFKMDTLQTILQLMKPGCYMASVDIKDAYYSVPTAVEHRKFLRFVWRDKVLQYTCFPNGLACAPRKFTKLLKPVFSMMRQEGHTVAGYIDDTYLQGESPEKCKAAVDRTVVLLQSLGFHLHNDKSCFEPKQTLTFLGFVLNSVSMTVTLTDEKATEIKAQCVAMMHKHKIIIQELAALIGKLVAAFPAVEYGQLHYRHLERGKHKALVYSQGDYSGHVELDQDMCSELEWWSQNVDKAEKLIFRNNPDLEISTDASGNGWGCRINDTRSGGRFTADERSEHINCQELLASLYSLQACCKESRNVHILVKSDNTTAVAYINNMGGTKVPCDRVARQIWDWAIARNIWLSATHIPGEANTCADTESRVFNDSTEWRLNPEVFVTIREFFGTPDVDLFASRLNTQIECFVSWRPDPLAMHVDALSLDWGKFQLAYIFPPFSLLTRCLRKIAADQAEAVVVAPFWPTQIWFAELGNLLTDHPLLLPRQERLLTQPATGELHPLRHKLRLVACRVSGKVSKPQKFRTRLLTSSWQHGVQAPKNSMRLTSENGWTFVAGGVKIGVTLL